MFPRYLGWTFPDSSVRLRFFMASQRPVFELHVCPPLLMVRIRHLSVLVASALIRPATKYAPLWHAVRIPTCRNDCKWAKDARDVCI